MSLSIRRGRLELSHRIQARLRNLTPSHAALQAGSETIVAWKLSRRDLEALVRSSGLTVDPIWTQDFYGVYLYLSIKTQTESHPFALVSVNRAMAESLTSQSILRIFAMDEDLALDDVTLIEHPWSQTDRESMQRNIVGIIETANSEGLVGLAFFQPTWRDQIASYE